MPKKYKIETDKGNFIIETDEPATGSIDAKTAFESNLPTVSAGSLARDYVLGAFQGLGGDPSSPILGTAKNVASGLWNTATKPIATGMGMAQQYWNAPSDIQDLAARGEQGAAAERMGQLASPLAMMAGGGMAGLKAMPESLMSGAASLRGVAKPSAMPMTATGAAIYGARTAARPVARGMEGLARILASKEGPSVSDLGLKPPMGPSPEIPMQNAPFPSPSPFYGNVKPPAGPPNPIDFPNAPFPAPGPFAGNLRPMAGPSNPIDFPNAPILGRDQIPQLGLKPPAGPPSPIEFPNAPTLSAERIPKMTAPEVNRWMNVQTKQLSHGANPAQQILDDGLLAPTKEATLTNVKTALDRTGGELANVLQKAGDQGIRINAEESVMNALDDATKTIGKRTDAAFQAQLSNIMDDILQKHPKLTDMLPEEAHTLKVDIGNAVQWGRGTAYEADINQTLLDMYRRINTTIKDKVAEAGPIQDHWANLYQGQKALRNSLLKDAIGRGTGAQPVPLTRPVSTMGERLAEALRQNMQ